MNFNYRMGISRNWVLFLSSLFLLVVGGAAQADPGSDLDAGLDDRARGECEKAIATCRPLAESGEASAQQAPALT